MGGRVGQMSRRDEEFQQNLIVSEHICDVSRITEVCCLAIVHYHNVDRLEMESGQ